MGIAGFCLKELGERGSLCEQLKMIMGYLVAGAQYNMVGISGSR